MIVGLQKFAEHFADYQDRYVLIGGAATWLVLDDAGLDPRVTQDLDIVLCLEVLDVEFATAFWRFIELGEYAVQEKSHSEKNFYRFKNPARYDFPKMLELFSRKPDMLTLKDDCHLTPIPVGEEVSSLSAILMDEGYYEFIHQHKKMLGGVPIVGEECLIPLKARAWLDLTQRKAEGEKVDSKDIKKHRNDILRLYQLLNPGERVPLPETIRADLTSFLHAVESGLEQQILKQLGIAGVSVTEVIQTIKTVYGCTEGEPDAD